MCKGIEDIQQAVVNIAARKKAMDIVSAIILVVNML